MKTNDLHSIMVTVSRAVIIIPVIFIVIILVLFFQKKVQEMRTPVESILVISPTVAVLPTLAPKTEKENVSLDLKGPLLCNYKTASDSGTMQIKNKNVNLQRASGKVVSNYILKGDCIYVWSNAASGGTKMCGMGQFVSMFEMFSNMGILSTDTLANAFAQVGGKQPTESQTTMMKELFKTCAKKEVADVAFTLPTNIRFAEGSIPKK